MGVQGVNELAVSPIDPYILASGGADRSIRIWSLDPTYERQPMAAICYGEGHKEAVLTVGFHRNGEYLLSGGQDARVCLWRVPTFTQDELGTDRPRLHHYPYFSSNEVHSDFVDCTKFHNDLIFSRASKENQILLWRIDNFSSEKEAPTDPAVPGSQAVRVAAPVVLPESVRSGTQSAWGGRFQRLLTFSQPDSDPFFLRFTLFSLPGVRPILAAGNTKSKIFFWDLYRIEEGDEAEASEKPNSKKPAGDSTPLLKTGSLGKAARLRVQTTREGSIASNASSAADSTGAVEKIRGNSSNIGDAFAPIQAHKTVEIKKIEYTQRASAWSPCGKWYVAVGDHNMIAVFHREHVSTVG
jgi:polycomb protein EED